MNHPRKPFKLDLMAALLVVVSLGVLITMIAQAGENIAPEPVVAYQATPATGDALTRFRLQ